VTSAPVDATIEVVTPENIAVHFRVAGPMRRSLAFAIDLALFCVIMVVVTMLLGFLGLTTFGAFTTAVWLIFAFLMWWFFFGAQEWLLRGRTLGKWALGLRVISIEGQPINGLQAIMRALLRAPDFAVPVIDLVTMAMNDRFQRLGDIACGTVVVFEERSWLFGVVKLDDPRAAQLAEFLPPEFEVKKSLAKALSTYVERRRFFSPPRRREVARHLAEPLLKRFGLPADTSYDLLLCALYYRAFVADRGGESERTPATVSASPFAPAPMPWPPAAATTQPEITFLNSPQA
jgi:uncharacterized RDD family membrane protein YckC